MILLISTNKESLHYYEFVKPIEYILKKDKIKFFTRQYKNITKKDLEKASKVIICGTSLKDFDYFNHINEFAWLKHFNKPLLGICAGMQITTHFFDGQIWGSGKKIDNRKEIGQTPVIFKKEFLGLKGNINAYELHQVGIRKVRKNFDIFAQSNKGLQAIKHKSKEIYGVLFHPEVRNKELISSFAN